MKKGEPRRPPAKPQFAAGVPASPQWKHDFTLTGEKVADRYAAVGYLEISVVRGGRMLDPSSTPSGNRTAAKLLRSKHCMYEDIPIHLFISSGSAGRVPFYAAIGLWSSLWDDQALRAQTVENAHIEADTPTAESACRW